MKKFFLILFLMAASLKVDAQVNFMGIPVDGDASAMLNQLRKKGFTDMTEKYEMEGMELPILKGTFNGKSVHVFVATNHGKVYRVHVAYAQPVSEAQIIIDYNNLLYQFRKNSKYLWRYGESIEQEENISYEMSIRNKQYDAVFYQILSDNLDEENCVWFKINMLSSYDNFWISLNYDNLLNQANGEDL